MSLSGALNVAQSALANTSAQAAIISRNIAGVNNPNYSRKTAAPQTLVNGDVSTGPTQRAANAALLSNLLAAQSASASSDALGAGLSAIENTLSLNTTSSTSSSAATDTSPATMMGAFSDALQQYAAAPDNTALAGSAVTAAKALASNISQASKTVQSVRAQADSDIATSVANINSILTQFTTVNDQIVAGTAVGSDVSDLQDTRDGLLKQLSNEIGITTTANSNGGTSIYTDSGVTLFNTTPRAVTFNATATYVDGTVGQAVMADGVPITGASAIMPISSGKLAGLSQLRDQTSVAYQNQLDQMATTLVSAFAESDQTGGGAPTLAGLFTTGSASLPTSPVGAGAALTVNARVDATQGGDPTRLRDGNISSANAAYSYNTSGANAFSGRLDQLQAALSQTQSFDPTSGGVASGSLATYAQSSVSWLEATRQTATSNSTYNTAVVGATTTALSNATGVNIDDEMSNMLVIEHAYQASAQLMNTVNGMYSALLQAFG